MEEIENRRWTQMDAGFPGFQKGRARRPRRALANREGRDAFALANAWFTALRISGRAEARLCQGYAGQAVTPYRSTGASVPDPYSVQITTT